MLLVPLVDVVKILHGYNTLETFVALLGLRVEGGRCIMDVTVDPECALWVDLFGLIEEGVIDEGLADVSLQILTSFHLFVGVYQVFDHLKRRRIIRLLRVRAASWIRRSEPTQILWIRPNIRWCSCLTHLCIFLRVLYISLLCVWMFFVLNLSLTT